MYINGLNESQEHGSKANKEYGTSSPRMDVSSLVVLAGFYISQDLEWQAVGFTYCQPKGPIITGDKPACVNTSSPPESLSSKLYASVFISPI